MIHRKRNRPIDFKYKMLPKGANDQYSHDNAANFIKEHIDIKLNKTS